MSMAAWSTWGSDPIRGISSRWLLGSIRRRLDTTPWKKRTGTPKKWRFGSDNFPFQLGDS